MKRFSTVKGLPKTAMVTGGSSGIGLSTVKYFCDKGIRVLSNGLDK